MRWIMSGILTVVLFSQSDARAIDTGKCIVNCSALVEIGDTFHVVGRNQEGKVFRILDTGINPKQIVKDFGASNKVIDGNAQSAEQRTSGRGRTNITHYTYETATEMILIMVVEFYDAEGKLIDVQDRKFATPKGDAPGPQN